MEIFKDCKWMGCLQDDELNIIASNMAKVQYNKGERIVKCDEFVTYIVYVVKGFVKIHSELRDKGVIIDICGPGKYAGLSSMITMERHPFSVTSLDNSTVCLINVSVIRDLIQKNGLFASQLINFMSEITLHYLKYNIISLTQNNIHGRLANTLLYLSEIFESNAFDFILSRKELSQLSNISRENVIKTLYEFDSEGLIRLNGKHIEILKVDQIRRFAEIG